MRFQEDGYKRTFEMIEDLLLKNVLKGENSSRKIRNRQSPNFVQDAIFANPYQKVWGGGNEFWVYRVPRA